MSHAGTTPFELIRSVCGTVGDAPVRGFDVPGGGVRMDEPGEARLRSLIDSVQAGVLMEDEELRIVLANRAFCELLGLDEDPEALVGWEARMVFTALRERFADPDALMRRTTELVHSRTKALSETVPLADGRTLERDFAPILTAEGYAGHFWILRDITSHIEAQETLRQSGQRLRALSEVTARLDPAGEEGLVEGLARMTGLLGLDFGLVVRFEADEYVIEQAHPGTGTLRAGARGSLQALRGLGALAASDAVVASPSDIVVSDGDHLLGDCVQAETLLAAGVDTDGDGGGQVLFGSFGGRGPRWPEADRELVRLFALWVGKSFERRRAEEALRTSESRYRDFVENTTALVCIHDLEGTVLEVNRAVLETLGLDEPHEVEGRSLLDVLVAEDRPRFAEYLEQVAREGIAKGTMTLVAADGRKRVISFENSLRRDGVDRPVVRGLGQDITEQFRAQKALRQRVDLEKLLVSISTSFINLPSSFVDRTIEHALEELGRYLEVDRCVVFLLDDERTKLERRFSWTRYEEEGPEIPDSLSTLDFPTFVQTINRLEPIRLDRVSDLPVTAPERRLLEAGGVRSLLAVPVTCRGEVLGSIDLTTTGSEVRWRDEVVSVLRVIGDIIGSALERQAAESALSRAHRELEHSNQELSWYNRRLALLNEMGDLLQSSADLDEAHGVIRAMAPRVCPGEGGAVYLFEPGGGLLSAVVTWGEGATDLGEPIEAESCWALRRGRQYRVGPDAPGPLCRHAVEEVEGGSLCIPLLAQGRALGILHLRSPDGRPSGAWSDGMEQLILNVAEHMALGLGNLTLRERLKAQTLRDPLTGLLNRRALEEQFEREVPRPRRTSSPLSVLMIDLDRFKRINDTYGHEGGDQVLIEVADLLRTSVRSEDLVARFGGEELAVLLTEADLPAALRIAEKLRREIERLRIRVGGQWIEDLTASIGVASLPECETTVDGLLSVADRAMYSAKENGRNRVGRAPAFGGLVGMADLPS